jgi:hypothetical protein
LPTPTALSQPWLMCPSEGGKVKATMGSPLGPHVHPWCFSKMRVYLHAFVNASLTVFLLLWSGVFEAKVCRQLSNSSQNVTAINQRWC